MSKNALPQRVIIVGAGGHGKIVASVIRIYGDLVVGFLDDRGADGLCGVNIIGRVSDIPKFTDCQFIIAIGNAKTRKDISEQYAMALYTAIHPSAVVAEDVPIGDGTVIMPNAVVNCGSILGRSVIINTAATVDHDNEIGSYVHISPGAHLSGNVRVCPGTWICTGGIVSNHVNITGGNVENPITIGAGAVLLKDVSAPGIYVGTPAKLKSLPNV